MTLKHNWGLLKNKVIGFKNIKDNQMSYHTGTLTNVKVSKEKLQFIFEDGKYLDVLTSTFNHLYIRKQDDIIWFINLNQESNIISGLLGFTMSDSYGFPVEMTEEIFEEQGFKLDIEGFNVMKQLQKEKSNNTFVNKNAF